MDSQEGELQGRCDRLSLLVQRFSVCLVIAEVLFVGWIVAGPAPANAGAIALTLPLALIVILWMLLQGTNHRLVHCGMQQLRYELSPRHVNRPEFAIRTAYHLIINWSAIPMILLAAFVIRPSDESRYLAYAAIAATIIAWLGFNLLHRRKNRARNLLTTTLIAATLMSASLVLVT